MDSDGGKNPAQHQGRITGRDGADDVESAVMMNCGTFWLAVSCLRANLSSNLHSRCTKDQKSATGVAVQIPIPIVIDVDAGTFGTAVKCSAET